MFIQAFFLECIFGVKIGALQSEAEEYVSSLHRLLDVSMSRIWKFWQWPDFIFHCSNTHTKNSCSISEQFTISLDVS
ncbi:hypothetical protein CEXT_771481 [Caerostris extrusa]|uniref:Uncharacterized protein n=1 Tax=Caerostris extrusa TaxID=172846 RepID=A0AAV4RLY5_CAEEX|nr:hypothetical protein CEXT_771481 [Caerostris extrusa]